MGEEQRDHRRDANQLRRNARRVANNSLVYSLPERRTFLTLPRFLDACISAFETQGPFLVCILEMASPKSPRIPTGNTSRLQGCKDARRMWSQFPAHLVRATPHGPSGSNCLSGRNFIRMIPKPDSHCQVTNPNHQLTPLLARLLEDCLFPSKNSPKWAPATHFRCDDPTHQTRNGSSDANASVFSLLEGRGGWKRLGDRRKSGLDRKLQ